MNTIFNLLKVIISLIFFGALFGFTCFIGKTVYDMLNYLIGF